MGPLPPLERAAPGLCSSWSALRPRAAGLASPHPSPAALTLRPPSTFASTAVSPFLYQGRGSGSPPADSLVHVRPAPPTRCQSHEQGCPSGPSALCAAEPGGLERGLAHGGSRPHRCLPHLLASSSHPIRLPQPEASPLVPAFISISSTWSPLRGLTAASQGLLPSGGLHSWQRLPSERRDCSNPSGTPLDSQDTVQTPRLQTQDAGSGSLGRRLLPQPHLGSPPPPTSAHLRLCGAVSSLSAFARAVCLHLLRHLRSPFSKLLFSFLRTPVVTKPLPLLRGSPSELQQLRPLQHPVICPFPSQVQVLGTPGPSRWARH